jgi:hypothetical protein
MNNNTEGGRNPLDLQGHWDAEECPIVEGVIFPDGRIWSISAEHVLGNPGVQIEQVLRPQDWTSLAELVAAGPFHCSNLCSNSELVDAAINRRIICGEGSWGGDGFVAVLKADSGKILWIAFFSTSNPFLSVKLEGDQVIATSNHGIRWRFPLNSPQEVTLDPCGG